MVEEKYRGCSCAHVSLLELLLLLLLLLCHGLSLSISLLLGHSLSLSLCLSPRLCLDLEDLLLCQGLFVCFLTCLWMKCSSFE